MSNIKFFSFAKITSDKLIYNAGNEKSMDETYKAEAIKVMREIKNIGLNFDERQKINTGSGSWFCKIDSKNILYLVLCTSSYPERHAYGMIQQLQNHLEKLADYGNEDDTSLKFHAKSTMNDLSTKYNDLRKVDKIYEVNQNLQDVQQQMEKNVRNMIDNQTNLENLDSRSQSMKMTSQQLLSNSKELESIMKWRNFKLNLIICFVILGVLAYILVPIIMKYAN
ncbi:hypothetical protein ABPG74_010360 [Tetrahymena malaccensis]